MQDSRDEKDMVNDLYGEEKEEEQNENPSAGASYRDSEVLFEEFDEDDDFEFTEDDFLFAESYDDPRLREVRGERWKSAAGRIGNLFRECRKKAASLLEKDSKLEAFLVKAADKFSRIPQAGDFLKYIPEMILMIRSYIRNEYRDIPKREIIEMTASLIYFVIPFDLIPDSLPVIGFLDDAFTVFMVLKWSRKTIDQYMIWRGENHVGTV